MAVYTRGAVVKGPDLFAEHDYRPYVCLSDDSHPFSDEEALYAAVTTTPRPDAVPLGDADFESGGLPHESYVNPWTVASIRHADIDRREGRLVEPVTEVIAIDTVGYNYVKIFHTPGCRNTSRDYSRQYEAAEYLGVR